LAHPSSTPTVTRDAANPPPATALPTAQLTWRGVVLAIVCQVALLFWVVRSEITARVFMSSWSICLPGILLLLGLRIAGAALGRFRLTQAELLTCYIAISTTVMLAGYNFMQLWLPALGTPFFFATGGNRWGELHPYIPTWLAPRDPEALRGLFAGSSPIPWRHWWLPLLAWASLMLAVAGLTLCLAILLGRRWIRRERLAFPTATLPLEITASDTALFRNRLFWIAFLIPAVLESLLAINYYVPSVPALTLKHRDVSEGLVNLPWTALRPIVFGLTPFIVGLAFLAPTDVSLSIWVFHWFVKLQRLVALLYGYVDATDLGSRGEPHLDDQTVGAFVGYGLFILWGFWRYDRGRSRAQRRADAIPEQDAGLDRLATVGLTATSAYVLLFMTAAGMPLSLAVGVLSLYILIVLVMSRARAEAGFAWTYGPDRGTASISHVLVQTFGSSGYSTRSLALLGFFHWFWWDLRFSPMPGQMEALKIGDSMRLPWRRLIGFMLLTLLVALLAGGYACLRDSYHFGWATSYVYVGPAAGAKVGMRLARDWIENPSSPRWDRTSWAVGGAAFTLLLAAMRQRLLWWPLHPVGYVMASTPTSYSFWGHYFVAWALKSLILRYGGMRLYRQFLPCVLGMILGDIVTQTLWSLVCSVLDLPVYQFVS
jgi:hypothetical protein